MPEATQQLSQKAISDTVIATQQVSEKIEVQVQALVEQVQCEQMSMVLSDKKRLAAASSYIYNKAPHKNNMNLI